MHKRWFYIAGVLGVFHASLASALPGAHGPAVSTFDTRGSTVVLAYRDAFSQLSFRAISYNANFSSTGGIMSAQFGAHYIAVRDEVGVELAHGAGATGVALWAIPLDDRFDNGVPRTALDLYLGGAPAVAVSGMRNFLTAPLVLGVGVSFAPFEWLTLTPWVEASPSFNFDTIVSSEGIRIEVMPQPDGSFQTTPLDEAFDKGIQRRMSFEVESRVGLMTTLRLGETWDVNLHGEYLTFGTLFGGQPVVQAGAGLAFHWDDVVPAVLPARRRLQQESCADVEERFMSCPRWHELKRAPPPAPSPPTSGGQKPL